MKNYSTKVSVLKTNILTLLFSCSFLFAKAHRVEFYTSTGCFTGQTMTVDAQIIAAPATTWYSWQYKTASGSWTCFVNGTNNINGTNFTVSNAKASNVLNDAPALTIMNITTALDNVQVRVIMSDGFDPCGGAIGTVWGGDDLAIYETKTFRIRVYASAADCGATTPGCIGNLARNATGYYGGFENRSYDPLGAWYTDNNFAAGTGSSEYTDANDGGNPLPPTAGSGTFQIANSPYLHNTGNGRFGPRTGSYQMVVHGSANVTRKAWYKTVSVNPGFNYNFCVWVARTQGSNPFSLQLRVNNMLVGSSPVPTSVGQYAQVCGSYTMPAGVTSVEIAISDLATTSDRFYAMDDICFLQSNAVLSLQSINVNTALRNGDVQVNWQTTGEKNTSKFEVERSVDGTNYETIATQNSTAVYGGNASYLFSDNNNRLPAAAVLYYRVKAISADGSVQYSSVSTVRLSNKAGISTWPNPFVAELKVVYTAKVQSAVTIKLVNTNGMLVQTKTVTVSRGDNAILLSGLETLAKGMYFVELTDTNTREKITQKIYK
jgi:Secretion system C-terminal sorting domain